MGLGSNLGDPEANLAMAAGLVGRMPGVTVGAASTVYFTEPQGFRDQPWFANQVLALDCDPKTDPLDLLLRLLSLETAMGRVRPDSDGDQDGAGQPPWERFAPRIIDMDLLLFGGLEQRSSPLTLPHPRMHERAFVLVPLLELDPDAVIPGRGRADHALALLDHRLDGNRIHQQQE